MVDAFPPSARRGAALGIALIASACSGGKSPAPRPAVEPEPAQLEVLEIPRVQADLRTPDVDAAYWRQAPRGVVPLQAQPMIAPRPATTTTEKIVVSAVHDGANLAVRLSWKDRDRSEAGRLGEYSDAAAIQFPVGDPAATPVMMGAEGLPVHIFHWRAQYQRDMEQGKPTMATLYPNMSVDMYAMDFKEAKGGTPEQKEAFSPGVAEGNPQAYEKSGVDEIIAEGFSTSAVQAGHSGAGKGAWNDGEWSLVITRPLAIEGGSSLTVGGDTAVAFAVWQGGEKEVGSRKSVMMVWLPVKVLP